MWRQLSRSKKSRVVLYGLVTATQLALAILYAMASRWGWAAVFMAAGVAGAYATAEVVSKNPHFLVITWRRGSGEPPPRTINSETPE
jgi:predicted MFS family arabinose efflux permease